jgi:radical SAM protein with 4Fe4S-binding SPASM domain
MRPVKINIESSTACSARCTFCPRYDMTRKMGVMSDDLFHKIIKEGKEMGVKRYSPFMNGDPFVFAKIWEWLDYMEKEGCIVSLYTNGSHIDVDRLAKYKNIEYLDFSINAATAETHKKIMRGPDFDTVVRNFEYARKVLPYFVRASLIKVEENVDEIDDFIKKFRKVKVCGFGNWTGARHSKLERKGKRVPCYPLFSQMYILWNGDVVPCCMDFDGKQILGNANTENIKDIWYTNSEWMREKHRKLEFDIPVCKDCNYNVDNSIQR